MSILEICHIFIYFLIFLYNICTNVTKPLAMTLSRGNTFIHGHLTCKIARFSYLSLICNSHFSDAYACKKYL